MGKGTGCFPSKGSKTVGIGSAPGEDHETGSTPGEAHETSSTPTKAKGDNNVNVDDNDTNTSALTESKSPEVPVGEKVKVFIVFYSMYGHVLSLAKKMKQGVDSVQGCEGCLFQVPDTLSDEVLAKMGAPAKDNSIPTIKAADLPAADACLFGFPTRYGAMAAQMKAFFDSTGSLWQGQSLAGKPAGLFVSTGTQGGGQETTALTAITQLVHHGMVFVPIGYTFGAGMFMLDEPRGGSPYGTGTFAGDGTKMPTKTELAMAEHQGKLTARVAKLLVQRN